ncbi:MAG: molybdopterin-synthase sulfurylase [Verrucomicrobiales bacterium]|nr:molybdopterin-synthase sulfurylase [Verrucomicrobiales bacterium]
MTRVLEAFPGAQRALFRKYHIGGCSSCGFQPTETLGQVCERNGNLDMNEVLAHIEHSHGEDQKVLIGPTELKQLVLKGTPVRLLDIRSREEWDGARIEGSVLFSQEVLQEMLMRWPKEETVVIYDHLGKRSMDAAAYFLGHGFSNVRSLSGGIDAWSTEADPNVRRYRIEN